LTDNKRETTRNFSISRETITSPSRPRTLKLCG